MFSIKFKASWILLGWGFDECNLSISLSPSYPLQETVRNMAYYDKDISYDHLEVFGCMTFVHISKNERSKLDLKTRQCIFLDYIGDQFSYKLFDPIARKAVSIREFCVCWIPNKWGYCEDNGANPGVSFGACSPQRQDINNSNSVPIISSQQQAEDDVAEDVHADP